MSTTADKLNYLNGTKDAIKQAIIDKGVTVSDSDTFRSYAEKIGDISGGGSCPVTLTTSAPTSLILNSNLIKTLDLSDVDASNVSGGSLYSPSISFQDCKPLESIIFPQNLDMSKVTSLSKIFSGCSSLTSLDLSSWNTSEVTNMSEMFSSCSSLTSLDLSNFDTSNVVGMRGMFSGCSSLTSLDLSNFDVSNIGSNQANDFNSLESMFTSSSSLQSITFPQEFFPNKNNQHTICSMSSMFSSCSSLTSLDLSSWNTSNVTNMGWMFNSCTSLTSLDLSSWNTSNVTNMSYMFNSCTSLTSLDLSSFNTSNVTSMSSMFQDCTSLTSLDLSSFNTSNVTSMYTMFMACTSLTSLDLSSFNTSNVTSMSSVFHNCRKLTNVTWGNNWASNSKVTKFSIDNVKISHESCLDLLNKLATRDNSPTLQLSTTTKGYMSEEEIAIATNKGWTVA